jgi:tRNA(fMet)-specific endonuclease VapC
MSRFLLDTDTVTLAHYGHPQAIQHLVQHPDSDIAIPAISVQEQMRGWLARLNRLSVAKDVADWYDFLVKRMFPVWNRYELISFSEPAILRFEQLRAMRLNIGLMDLRISAVALQDGFTVVTRNQRDFNRVPGLTSEDWSVCLVFCTFSSPTRHYFTRSYDKLRYLSMFGKSYSTPAITNKLPRKRAG